MQSVIIRPARAEDKDAVLAFTTNTWEWGDYISYVWDQWLADPQGELTVAELEGRVVAMTMSTVLCPGEGWLQGLRVHPDYRRLGLARRLTAYQLDLMRRWGAHTVRLAVHSPNIASQTHVARAGFRRLGTFIVFEHDVAATPLASDGSSERIGLPEAETAWEAIQSSPTFAAAARLWATGWAWQSLTRDKLVAAVEQGHVLGVRLPSGQWGAIAIAFLDDDTFHVAYVDGSGPALTRLGADLPMHTRQLGATSLVIVAPPVASICDAFRQAGYGGTDRNEGAMYIYELTL